MNKPGMGKIEKTVMALILCTVFFVFASPAYADDDVDVTVTVSQILCVDYIPIPPYTDNVVFDITLDDMIEGSLGIVNCGDIYWCSNIGSWKIQVHRSEWTLLGGGTPPYFGWYLQIKYGPPNNDDRLTVETYKQDWITSDDVIEWGQDPIGNGFVYGVDWKIKELRWEWTPPGSYVCTVYFTIIAGS